MTIVVNEGGYSV